MFVTLQQMKDYLGETGSTYDTFLTLQIKFISGTIEQYCARKFEMTDYKETFYGDEKGDTDNLIAFHFPIKEITAISRDGSPFLGQYRIEPDLGYVISEKEKWFGSWEEKVIIEYSAGYEEIPDPLLYVVYNWVAEKYNRKKIGIETNFGTDVQRISIPGALSLDFDYTLNTNERSNAFGNILGNYINVVDPYRSERVIMGKPGRVYVEQP